jgi:hypothetical protein
MNGRRYVIFLVALMALLGCPKTDQSLVLVGGKPLAVEAIDGQPLNVLPSGAIVLGTLDAEALFKTNLGGQVGRIVAGLLPLGPESGFVPARDVKRIYGAVYAMQGADFAAVVQGNFNVAAIQQAAQTRAQTPSGAQLVQTRYAGYDIYTVANIGFVVLTQQTILSGNETGMRRALDRLRFGPFTQALPSWMVELLQEKPGTQAGQAAFAVVGDVTGQGVVEAAADQLPFLGALRLLRVRGNFQPPGMNVVGSLTYGDAAAAAKGAEGLGQLQQYAYLVTLLATFGFGGRAPDLEVTQQDANVAFASQIDTATINLLLTMMAQWL